MATQYLSEGQPCAGNHGKTVSSLLTISSLLVSHSWFVVDHVLASWCHLVFYVMCGVTCTCTNVHEHVHVMYYYVHVY